MPEAAPAPGPAPDPGRGPVVLGTGRATAADVAAVARGASAVLDPGALARVEDTHRRLLALVDRVALTGELVYGLTTGVGDLVDVTPHVTGPDATARTQLALLRSHASGVGPDHDDAAVRAIIVVTVEALARGISGVSPELLVALVALLEAGVVPAAPAQGSVGYLTATAHIGLVVFGHGHARYRGELLSGAQALERAGLSPLVPGPREGHALISGTYEITGIGALAVDAAHRLVAVADAVGALSVEAMGTNARGFDARVVALRPHPGQAETARRLRALLAGSALLAPGTGGTAQPGSGRLQDALSLRCIPQVHGGFRDCLAWVTSVLETEIASVTDNPAFVVEDDDLVPLSSGNGHGAPVALALDTLAVAVSQLTSMSAARSDRLTTSHLSGLPPFLTEGLASSGLMTAPYAAAAVAAEVRGLASPATVHSGSTCAGQEDHVSMGTTAAIQARRAVGHAEQVLAIELLCAAQGLDLRRRAALADPGAGTAAVHAAVRAVVAFREADTEVAPDIAAVHALLTGDLAAVVEAAVAGAAPPDDGEER